MSKIIKVLLPLTLIFSIAACSPEVGSEAWCEVMADKPKRDWTVNEATEFAKNCVFKTYKNE